MRVNSNHPVTRDNKRNNDKLLLGYDVVIVRDGWWLMTWREDKYAARTKKRVSTRTPHAQERG